MLGSVCKCWKLLTKHAARVTLSLYMLLIRLLRLLAVST